MSPPRADPPDPGLRAALGRLTEMQRTAVYLVDGCGWGLTEAADVLGVSLSTLRNHRAAGSRSCARNWRCPPMPEPRTPEPERDRDDLDGPGPVVAERLRSMAATDQGRYTAVDPADLRMAPVALVATGLAPSRRGRRAFVVAAAALVAVLLGVVAAGRPGGNDGTGGVGGPVSPATAAPGAVAPVANVDHWHAAYGFSVCGTFLEPLADLDGRPDVHGIHTHGDGLIHVHPFRADAAGAQAQVHRFADMVGVQFVDDHWVVPNVTVFPTNLPACSSTPSRAVVYEWDADDLSVAPVVHRSNFGAIPSTADRRAFTFAIEPIDGSLAPTPPPSIRELDLITDMGVSATTPR